jgi:hypothetical protein
MTPLIITLGTRWRWVVNFTPRSFYPRYPIKNVFLVSILLKNQNIFSYISNSYSQTSTLHGTNAPPLIPYTHHVANATCSKIKVRGLGQLWRHKLCDLFRSLNGDTHTHTNTHTDTHTDTQTHTQTHKHTDTHAQTHTQTHKTHRQTDRHTHTNKNTNTQTTHTHTHTHTQTRTNTHKHIHKHKHIHTHTHTYTENKLVS